MQLKLTRSQRDGGMISKTAIFCLDARVQFTREEQASVTRYRLGGQLIYNNEASQRRVKAAEAAIAEGTGAGGFKALAQFTLARLHLNITVDGLQRGQHIECKSLEELLDAEDALMEACKRLRMYLDTAATFDGREVLFDFSSPEPTVISASPPPMLVAPGTAIARPPSPSPAQLAVAQPAPELAPLSVALPPDPVPSPAAEALDPFPALDPFLERVNERLAVVRNAFGRLSPEAQVFVIILGMGAFVILYRLF